MSVFAGMRKGKTFEKGNYLAPGEYDLEIKRLFVKKTRKGKSLFTAEMEIVTSNNPAHPAKGKATWQQDLGDADIAFGAMKQFMYAVLGLDPVKDKATIDAMDVAQKDGQGNEIEGTAPIEQATERAVSGDGTSLAGTKVHVKTWIKKTVAKQVDFTVHDWSPFKGQAA